MRIRSLPLVALFGAVTLSCVFFVRVSPARAAEAAAGPVQNDAAGKQAWDLLGGLYQKEERGRATELEKAVDAALQDTGGADAAKAQEGAQLLLALFRQAAADEVNGRAEWLRSPAWGGGANSQARSFREGLAFKTGKSAKGAAAVPLAEWLLYEERLAEVQAAAVPVLERTTGTAADAALVNIMEKGVHYRPALVMALEQTGKRSLTAVKERPELLRRWTTDARAKVRAAAAGAMKALGMPDSPEFKPADGFHEEERKLLADIYALFFEAPAVDAVFGKFQIKDTYGDGKTRDSEVTGWLRSEKDGVMQVVSWRGEVMELKPGGERARTVRFEKADPATVVQEVLDVRATKDRDKATDKLSSQGSFTGQFESRQLSAPEGFLAAWLFKKGDLEQAAALIFPALDNVADDRWPLVIMVDLAGHLYHQEMLEAFSYERDYAKTVRLAKHLSGPLFANYQYHERARELAEQLPKRAAEDFKTLTLPTAEEWKKGSAGMAREKQVEYLASRLRLLNCFQFSQPGNVNYEDQQYREPGPQWGEKEKKAVKVINPYNELRQMKLTPADLMVLAPYLTDDLFLPTYSYWRSFHPDRTLHRVNWVVAGLVNAAARRNLIDTVDWQELTPQTRDARVAAVTAWAKEMEGKSLADILRANMSKAENERAWFRAAREMVTAKEPSLLPDVLRGAERFPEQKADIAEICYWADAPEAARPARLWMKLKEPRLKLYAALILTKHGTPEERPAAVAAVKEALAEKWDSDLQIEGLEPILATGNEQLTGLACELLRRPELEWDYMDAQAAHRLFLTKHPAALAALLDLLNSGEDPKERKVKWEGQEVKRTIVRGDLVARVVGRMRKGDYEFPANAPDKERAEARAKLGEWLKQQAGLLNEGKPTPELDTDARRVRASRAWIDAP